jgi:hypothetical protein
MEYTTIEAIQELCNNPTLEFQYIFSGDGCIWKMSKIGGSIKWHCKSKNTETTTFLELSSTVMDKKWTLIQKPVDFMTAINSNKKIKLFEPDKYKFLTKRSSLYNYNGLPTVLDYIHSYGYQEEWQLLNAKWLIED